MIVVFDTNIFVSALVFPGGRAEEAIIRILRGTDHLVISKPLLDELLVVLARKFDRDREEFSRVALWISELAEWVHTSRRINEVDDEADNRVLECAVAGKAELIVTGDKALLQLRSFEGILIESLSDYVSRTR